MTAPFALRRGGALVAAVTSLALAGACLVPADAHLLIEGQLAVPPRDDPPSPAATVAQHGRKFLTKFVELRRHQVLRFTNDDDSLHHIYVESPTFRFDSDIQEPGRAVDMTLKSTGDFTVMCGIHPKMRMTVRVTD